MASKRPPELSAQKRALLDALLQNEGIDSSFTQKIPKRDDDAPIPLSFAQESLWVFEQMMPATPLYNIATSIRLSGPLLHVRALEGSINEIVRRHEILRTTFTVVGEEPVQSVAPSLMLPLTLVDLQELPDAEREARALASITDEAHKPFDLAQGPLLRTTLWRLGPEEHVFLVVMHHIISEASSVAIFFQELSTIYEAFIAAKPSPLTPLEVQFGDYATWQRRTAAERGRLEPHLAYWKEQLRERLPVLELPSDRPRPSLRTFPGGSQSIEISATLSAGLRNLSRQEGTTLFMTLLAAITTLLHRHTGQEDIVVGSPATNRNLPELRNVIGYFVNPQPLRIDLSGNPTFRELLRRVRDVCLSALSHQELPLEKLIEELRLERGPSSNPLFQTAFVLHNTAAQPSWRTTLRLPGITQQASVVRTRTAKLDLIFEVEEAGESLTALFDYNTDLFNDDTIARMLQHLATLLRAIVSNADEAVGKLPIVTDAERRLLVEWNDTAVEFPRTRTVQERFQEQVEQRPASVAVAFGHTRLTYQELDARANQLARFLQKRGVGPDVLVGLCLERSIDFIVAAVGVLKAGGAYVPIDPSYPGERIGWMLEDAAVRVLLTHARAGGLPATLAEDTATVCLDTEWPSIAVDSSEAPNQGATIDNLAYVIYTSGSTGKPKGVPIRHRNLHNLICWHQSAYNVTPADRATQISSPAFDASVWEIWPYLTAGASVHIPDDETRADVASLVRWLETQQITLTFLPTPLAEAALREPWSQSPALRVLLTGGDKLHQPPQKKLPFRLVNHYGPTENTVVSTCCDVELGFVPNSAPPIGRPLPNTVACVVDRFLRPVPVGVPGELVVGGAQLAEGYWHRPELTAEKFIPSPFPAGFSSGSLAKEGARIYRTGDLVRWRADGNLEFLGRIDEQVKIRGFRIEPGEIEVMLAGHSAVRDAVVAVREDARGEKRLVAYVVGREGEIPTPAGLREHLKRSLPDYMMPASFVVLDALPLTANGKIDRKALPAPEDGRSNVIAGYVAPRNEVEGVMAEIWADALGTEKMGVFDNFFELGGHSISAVRLIARLRTALNIDLPLRSIFLDSTIAGLSKHIHYNPTTRSYEHSSEIPRWNCLVPIQPKGSSPPLFLVAGAHADEDAFLRYLSHMIRHLGLDQPVFALKPRGLDGQEEPHSSVAEIAREYAAELRAFHPAGPYLLAGECVGGVVAFEVARQLMKQGAEVSLLALLDTIRPTPLRSLAVRFRLLTAMERTYRTRIGKILGSHPRSWVPLALAYARRKIRARFPKTTQDVMAKRIQRTEQRYPSLALAYRAESYPGKITLIASEQGHRDDPALGWNGVAAGGLVVHVVPGDHVTRLTQHGKAVADQLLQCIEQAHRGAKSAREVNTSVPISC